MRHVALVAVGACVSIAIAAPANAKQCPAGQILRVSKGVCMDKAAAVKSGVVPSRERVARLGDKPARSSEAPDARAQTVVEKSPAVEPAKQRTSRASDALAYAPGPSEEVAAKPAPSPYGELRLDYFGGR